MNFFSRFGRIVSVALLVIGGIPLMIMMAIVTGNSLGRIFFRTPIMGTIEIAGLAGAIVVAAAVGYTSRERGNVAVDVLLSHLKSGAKRVLDIITLFLSFAASAFLLYAIVYDAFQSAKLDEETITLSVPTSPFKFVWAAGIFILACFVVVHLVKAIRGRGEQ
jgi:TRAP-type C4-dicarboxylate transport system permease small subunit